MLVSDAVSRRGEVFVVTQIAIQTHDGAVAVANREILSNLRQRSQSLRTREVAHAREGARCDKYGRRIGLVVVMLTTVIGTTAFTQLNNSTSNAIKIAVGAVGILAAVLAAFKENAAYGKSSADHAAAAAGFGELHHDVEEILLKYERKGGDYGDALDADLAKVNKAEADLMSKAIAVGPRAYADAEQWVRLHGGS